MKTISTLFCAGMLMSALCAGFVACNEPKDTEQKDPPEEIGIAPVPVSEIPEEVAAFFGEYLSSVSGSDSELFFVEEQEKPFEEREMEICLMINSSEELKAIMSPSVELPVIDFDKYTLVIGQATMPGTGYTYLGQSLDTESNPAKLNLIVKIPDGSYGVLCPLYYWGLYSKLSVEQISISVTFSNESKEKTDPKEETDPWLGQEIPGMETHQATGTVIGRYGDSGFGSFLVQVDKEYPIGMTFEFYNDRWIPAKMPKYGTYDNMIQVQHKLPVKIGYRISFSFREFIMEKDRDLFLIGDGTVKADHVSPPVPILVITKYKVITE